LNFARAWACETFRDTFQYFHGSSGVSESAFSLAWRKRLSSRSELSDGGWYDPPPGGVAVLFGTGENPRRVNFGSLRDPANYPSDIAIDWSDGLLYAYCSPVDLRSGMAGDFALTLYCGQRAEIRAHIANCYAATREVLSCIAPSTQSDEIFRAAEEIFTSRDLFNAVESVTDTAVLDLGHSIPVVATHGSSHTDRTLSAALRKEYSHSRRFINKHDRWPLASATQFTIEPQLRSRRSPSLPQVSFHYVVEMHPHITVHDECDDVMRLVGML
jgi:hypothetical protein